MATSLDLVYNIVVTGKPFTLTLPITTGTISSIDWGDGTVTLDQTKFHRYTSSNTYTVKISGTGITTFDSNIATGRGFLTQCTSFGEIGLTNTSYMFLNCSNLTAVPATLPTTSTITNMSSMFSNAIIFNGNISGWNVSNVTNMSGMFENASAFNQNIGSWNISNVTNMGGMLTGSALSTTNYDALLNGWAIQTVQPNVQLDAEGLIYTSAGLASRNILTGSPNSWGISGDTYQGPTSSPLVLVYEIQDPGYILELPIVDGTIESIEWGDLTPSDNLTTHTYTDPGTYTVSITGTGITSFNYNNGSGQGYLTQCTSFGEIGLTDASNMFRNCSNLTVVPATLPTSSTITNMSSMFEDAIAFNQDISGWTTTNVTDMSSMFRDVTNFNQNIGGWTTTNVTDMSSMFRNAQAFNQPLDNWDVSSVETTYSMFYLAASFNQDLNSWDVSSVQDFSSMFESATAFNGNISNWTPTNVTDMSSMFSGATAFNQNIGNWNIASVIFMSNMLDGTALSTTNYNALLNGWSIQTVQSGVSFGAQGLTYTSAGEVGRNILTGSPNAWTILGDTYLPPPVCFKEGSQILTDTGYKAIEMLRKGDLVKTSKNGFLPIDMIGKRVIYNPAEKERIKEQLYKCSKEQYPEVFEDLVITGCHSILVDRFASKEQREKAIEVNSGRLCITDKKYRLPACVDDRASVYEVKGDFTIYHIALENDDYYMNYGVYANGLLVETCSKRYLKELSNMELIE